MMKPSQKVIRLVHWNESEAVERSVRLEALGYQVEAALPQGASFVKELEVNPPDAVVIDLERLPSQGRDLGVQMRTRAGSRGIPLVFVGGKIEKVERVRSLLPDAAFTDWEDIASDLPRAIAEPPEKPIDPGSVFAAYSATPLVKKLGINAESQVRLVGAPDDFENTLGELPEGARLREGIGACSVMIWFVSDQAALNEAFSAMAGRNDFDALWMAWPKKASGVVSDLSQQTVRQTGLNAGLVDYKICSIDATWSGLCFTQRKG